MKIIVKRLWRESESVQGMLLLDDSFNAYTLEPKQPIPAGTYDLTIRYSPRFERLMPHVENVPGHTGILIHFGNFPKDTEDCLLVGSVEEQNFVGHSVEEFNLLFQKFHDALQTGPQVISYIDPPKFVPADIDGEISV